MTGIPPLIVEFEVAAPVDHAFAIWVQRPGLWWPKGHTMSGDPASIVIEAEPGGRIVETGRDGTEYLWGEVLACDPPHRLHYLWHLFFPREDATEVDLRFEALSPHRTRVRLEQTGWDALGDAGPPRRERTIGGWAAVTAPYRAVCDSPAVREISSEER